MVLISNGKSTKANGYLDRTLEQLKSVDVECFIFDKIMEIPIKDVIMEGAAFSREHKCDFIVALGGGAVIDSSSATAQHSMEHSRSAYHHNLPHGAGLIMISSAFAEFFIDRHACDEQFIKMAKARGIIRCKSL